LWKTLHQRAHL